MNRELRLRALVKGVVSTTAVVAIMASASPASAQVPPPPPPPPSTVTVAIEIQGTAALMGHGAAVAVAVEVTCLPSPFPIPFPGGPGVLVSVTQRHGHHLVNGSGFASPVCDGSPHLVDVVVRAYDRPFKPGIALASASTFSCDFLGCQSATDTAEIRVRNA